MGSDDDDDRKNRHHHVSHKVTLAAVSSLFAVTLFLILLFLYSKYRQNRRLRRRRIDFVSRLITAQTTAAAAEAGAGDHAGHPSRKTAHGGLDPAVVSALPEFIYKKAPPSEAAVECSVCLGALAEAARVRLLPNCGHTFHVECVDLWLASHTTCPLCRAEVEPPPHPPPPPPPPPPLPFPTAEVIRSTEVPQPTAPPIDEISLLQGETAESLKPSGSGGGAAGSRLSSFRRMLSRERSSTRSLGSCGDQVAAGVPHHHDLERQ